MRKVRILSVPEKSLGGRTSNQFNKQIYFPIGEDKNPYGEPDMKVNNTLQPTTWDNANVEAEKGETVVTNFMKDGIPEHYVVGGKPHSQGGTPLNLPPNSFVFSKDRKLKIQDPAILEIFGKGGKKGFVPADIAKQYKINEYRKVLANPDATPLEKSTAERMISNYNLKLGALAMVQESMKGFPDGIPAISMGYLEKSGIDPASLIQPETITEAPKMKKGGAVKYQKGGSKPYDKVRFNPNTGGYEALDKTGKVIGYINFKQDGGSQPAPSISQRTTRYQNIPKDAVKWDVTKEGYDESQVQPGDYIKREDGKWYQATGYTTKNYGYEDSRLGELQPAYGHLQQTILNDPDLQGAIYANYQNHIENGQLSAEEKKRLLAIPQDEVIKIFLEGQKQVYAINASGALYQRNEDGSIKRNEDGSPMMQSEKDLKKWETRGSEVYKDTMLNLGFTEDEIFSGETTAIFQAAYRGLEDASRDPQFSDTLANFNITPVGLKDSHGLHTYDDKPISPVDKFFGNTTAGQAVLPKELDQDLTTSEVEWTEEDPITQTETPTIDDRPAPQNAPWWLQDIIKTAGAAGDMMRIKKHSPWQATPGVYLPQPTFYDPTRALASNAELSNIATQGAGVFAGPQAFNARASQIQGQAAGNAANILGQYENQNVGVANQFEMNKAQILNQASANKANLATTLYDKNVIANQQFDNAKAMGRQQLRQAYLDAITNRAQTQTLNQLYPQYNVDPSTGGFMQFTKGRDLDPSVSNSQSLGDLARSYKYENPDMEWKDAIALAKGDMGIPDDTPVGLDPAYFANYANMMP